MKKLLAVFLVFLACGPKPALKVSSGISQMEAAPVTLTQTFQVQPGDSFMVDFRINTSAMFHLVQFNVITPACLVPKQGRLVPGAIFAGQNADFNKNYFTGRTYIAVSVDRSKPGDTGNKLIASHVFTATGPGSGDINLTDVMALKYDNSQQGYASLATSAEILSIVFEQVIIEAATVSVQIRKL